MSISRFLEADDFHLINKKEMSGLILEDILNRKNRDFVPDTTATDKYFIEGFLNREMRRDFWDIVRDFLKHHFADVEMYESLNSYNNTRPDQTDPVTSLEIYFLGIMYKAAKSGDLYSKNLFQYLYKTYYKKEYRQLKRFRKISVSEIMALSEDDEGDTDYESLARIIGMCDFFDIEIDDKVSVVHLMLEKDRKEAEEEDEIEFLDFPEGLYAACVEKVEEWIEQEAKSQRRRHYIAKHYDKLEEFVANCLQRNGYPEDYIYRSNPYVDPLRRVLATTLALLKYSFPKEEFTYQEVQAFAHTYQAIEALVHTSDDYYENITRIFGKTAYMDEDKRECLFNPDKIIAEKEPVKSPVVNKPISTVPIKAESLDEKVLVDEIALLRKKLREAEQESSYYKQQNLQAQKTIKEMTEHLEKSEKDRDELIALRNHVYSLSEEVCESAEVSLEEMKKEISSKKIVIIGGHTNWINKVKKEFPGWKFFDANVSRINEAMNLEGTQKAYFFTNHLSHTIYGKYIALLRENKIPFGYLHSINIDSMVGHIYRDFAE